MTDQENLCPTCQGRRLQFIQASEDVRYEIHCQTCHGEGTLSAALAHKLSGEPPNVITVATLKRLANSQGIHTFNP